MFDAAPPAGFGEVPGLVAGAIVGHDTVDLDVERPVIGAGFFQECNGTLLLLIWHDHGEGDPGVIVDGDMDELPAPPDGPGGGGAVSRDSVAYP